jgi:GH15 family glucan-1,4-alpha-glucosidase
LIKNAGKLGWRIHVGTSLLNLRSDIELEPNNSRGLSGKMTLKGGDTVAFSLTFSEEGPAVLPALGDLVGEKLKLTIDWWQHWAARAKYDGPYRKQVIRSALVLALLSFAPSGALVAAPTTSLPERIGGDLNWDYRFCWLRDAALAVRALSSLGYDDDAEGFLSWLLHTTRLTRLRLKPLYDVYGNDSPREQTLSHLAGYADSRPVRLGNAAADQLQFDVYGEVLEAVSHFLSDQQDLDRDTQKMLCGYGERICGNWRQPDHGIWEQRRVPQLYTQSRVLCWVALDRLIDLQRRGRIKSLPSEKFRETRDLIRNEIEQHAWSEKQQAYTQVFHGETLDASALLLALYGFEDAKSVRMQQTHRRLREELCPSIGLMYRDNRSETKNEGCFGMCAFWEANFLARSGNLHEAHRVFERVLGYANDVGLFAEEIDPETGDALGNFPQALTHLALISAALALRDAGWPA